MSPGEMLPHVLSALTSVRRAKKIRRDLLVAGNAPISGIFFNGNCSLAEILRGENHVEEWRFLYSLDQSSPWDEYPGVKQPGEFQEVNFQGRVATGMLWAKQNDSIILSFAFPPNWADPHVRAEFREMDQMRNINSNEIDIPNISTQQHVEAHRILINDYGRSIATSSLIYEGNGFVIRMYSNDHNPPHFHVMGRGNTADTIARYAIETLDILSGEPSPALRARVLEWARNRRDDLMICWHRCQVGEHPYTLE